MPAPAPSRRLARHRPVERRRSCLPQPSSCRSSTHRCFAQSPDRTPTPSPCRGARQPLGGGSRLSVVCRRRRDSVLFRLSGNLDIYTVPHFVRQIEFFDPAADRLLVDLADVRLLDSAGICALVSLRNRAHRAGRRLRSRRREPPHASPSGIRRPRLRLHLRRGQDDGGRLAPAPRPVSSAGVGPALIRSRSWPGWSEPRSSARRRPRRSAPCGAWPPQPPGCAASAPRSRRWPRGARRRACRPGTAGG